MENICALKPNLWSSLPDEVPSWVSDKRNIISVDRTTRWLDDCLSMQPVICLPKFLACINLHMLKSLKYCFIFMHVNLKHILKYVRRET
jgi:queuine tRNA-ribosyltransferase subunit QTRTD1